MTIDDKNREAYMAYLREKSLLIYLSMGRSRFDSAKMAVAEPLMIDNEEARNQFLKHYKGEWKDFQTYAQNFIESNPDSWPLPEWAVNHMDWGSFSDYLFSEIKMFYAIAASGQSIYVFSNENE